MGKACAVEWAVKCPVSHWPDRQQDAGMLHGPEPTLSDQQSCMARRRANMSPWHEGRVFQIQSSLTLLLAFCFQFVQIQLGHFTAGIIESVKSVFSDQPDSFSALPDVVQTESLTAKQLQYDWGYLLPHLRFTLQSLLWQMQIYCGWEFVCEGRETKAYCYRLIYITKADQYPVLTLIDEIKYGNFRMELHSYNQEKIVTENSKRGVKTVTLAIMLSVDKNDHIYI